MLIDFLFCMTMRFLMSTLLLIPHSLDQSSVCYPFEIDGFYFCFDKVLVQLKESKKVLVTTSIEDLNRKVREIFAIHGATSILVQKYNAEQLVKQCTLTTTQISQMVTSSMSLWWNQSLHVVYRYECESDVFLEYFHF